MRIQPNRAARIGARFLWLAGSLLLANAALASSITLDEIYGGMAKGCTYSQKGNYAVITAYVDEHTSGPQLARPEGGKRLARFLGRAKLRVHAEFYTLTIPVSGATLYGIPVAQLAPYRGIGAGVAGVTITFAMPIDEVKTNLQRTGVKLVAHDHGWGDITPELLPTPDGKRTELACDLSM